MPGLSRFLMEEVELPLMPVVVAMEDVGCPVDPDHFVTLLDRLQPELTAAIKQIREQAGRDLNPQSPKQLAKYLYEDLGLPVLATTDSGAASTNIAALKQLEHKHAAIGPIIRYREVQKIVSTYCKIPEQLGADGRFHASFNQLGAETGRFTSASIVQTLPKKKDEFGIRKGFRATPRHHLVAADFDQQELRVLAQASGDKKMREAFAQDVDLHGLAAVKMFRLNCEPSEVKEKFPNERDRVKALQFGLIYGRSPFSIALALGISQAEAEKLLNDYFVNFPAVKRMIAEVHSVVVKHGFVDDMFGRRRYLPDARLPRPRKRYERMNEAERRIVSRLNAAKREAQNFVIQGASATITKLAMLRCHDAIQNRFPSVRMFLTLHDELFFEVPTEVVPTFAAELPSLMCSLGLEERFDFQVPLKVEVKVGPSMGELSPTE
jgi:DNA polymerase-1